LNLDFAVGGTAAVVDGPNERNALLFRSPAEVAGAHGRFADEKHRRQRRSGESILRVEIGGQP